MKLILLFFFLFSISISASTNKFYKCYGVFTRERLRPNDEIFLKVKAGQINEVTACKLLLEKAMFDSEGNILSPEKNEIGKKILRTINAFHSSWFVNYHTYMTLDGQSTFDLVELEEPALFITKALFDKNMPYKNIILGKLNLEGTRVTKIRPEYFIGSLELDKVELPKNGLDSGLRTEKQAFEKWFPKLLDRGELVGIRKTKIGEDVIPSYVDDIFFPKYHKESFDINESLGGGLMGTNSFLIFNFGRIIGEKSDGGKRLPRRLMVEIIRSLLGRDLPVLTPEDAIKYLVENKKVNWSYSKNCMACHVTMDYGASVARNIELVISKKENKKGSYHMRIHPPTSNGADVLYKDIRDDFYLTEPTGRFIYRTIDDKLIDKPLKNIEDLGFAISQLDEFYLNATLRYFNFLTGSNINVVNFSSKSDANLDKKLKDFLVKTSHELRQHQRLDKMILTIVNSEYF